MRRYAISVLVVLVAAAAAAIARPGEDGGGASAAREPGRVTRVVDGDTIIVGDERVRLIGVDTPETKKPGTPVQCFGKKATAFTKRLWNTESRSAAVRSILPTTSTITDRSSCRGPCLSSMMIRPRRFRHVFLNRNARPIRRQFAYSPGYGIAAAATGRTRCPLSVPRF